MNAVEDLLNDIAREYKAIQPQTAENHNLRCCLNRCDQMITHLYNLSNQLETRNRELNHELKHPGYLNELELVKLTRLANQLGE